MMEQRIVSLLMLCITSVSHADLSTSNDLLQELEWLKAEAYVTTASKKRETAQEAPANIAVLTRDQIESLASFDLYETMNFIPGISTVETYWGYTEVVFRGNYQEHYTNKSLFMVNGHSYWGGVYGSYHLESIPMNVIKQLEVVKGPGSSLYGTNAYAGAINLITLKGEDLKGGNISVKAGSFDTTEVSAVYGDKSNDLDYIFATSFRERGGFPYAVDNDELSNSGTFDYQNDVDNFYAQVSNKKFELTASYFSQDKQKFGVVPILGWGGITNFSGYYIDAKYKNEFSKVLSLTTNVFYDKIDNDIVLDTFSVFGKTTAKNSAGKQGIEIIAQYNPEKDFNITAGAVYTNYFSDPYEAYQESTGNLVGTLTPFSEYHSNNEQAVYAQMDWHTSPSVKYVAGLRYTNNNDSGDDISPNIGLVNEITDNGFLKILYGEAFRSPSFFEKYAEASPVILGDPKLKPEKIKTLDIVFDYTYEKSKKIILDFFYLDTDDSIERVDATVTNPPYGLKYDNSQGHTTYGLEVSWEGNISPTLSAFVNATLMDGEEKQTKNDIAFLTKRQVNFGINWKYGDLLTFSGNIHYTGERKDNDSSVVVDDYSLINLQVVYAATKDIRILLSVNNLLDKDYSYPEHIRQNIDDVPGGQGRAVYGKFEWHF